MTALSETPSTLPAGLSLPIWWVGRQWAVTGYGLERIDGWRYEIEAKRLGETRAHKDGPFCDWHVHLAHKQIDIEDFISAYRVAMKKWPRHVRTITPAVLERSEEEGRNIVAENALLRPIYVEVRAEMSPGRKLMSFDAREFQAVHDEVHARARARYGKLPNLTFGT